MRKEMRSNEKTHIQDKKWVKIYGIREKEKNWREREGKPESREGKSEIWEPESGEGKAKFESERVVENPGRGMERMGSGGDRGMVREGFSF